MPATAGARRIPGHADETATEDAASLALAAGLLAACGSGGSDKAGGASAPVTLRLAVVTPGEPFFADEVRRLSNGRMRVKETPSAGGTDAPDAEVRVARMVSEGRFDVGIVPAPTWDELGVTSLQALQAPFLITDQSLLKAVVHGPLAARMLDGLRARNVIGLALMAGMLRHPLGYERPLTTLADFRGKRIRVPPSRASEAVISALGAKPVHIGFDEVGPLVERHGLDGEEMPFFAPPNAWITANVTFYPVAVTLFVNAKRFAKLSGDQQRILRAAAVQTARRVDAFTLGPKAQAPGYCGAGHVVLTSQADLATLERATRPVYAQLERDPKVKALIAAIRELKRRTPADPAPKIPASCSKPPAATRGHERDPRFLDGTYRWRITRAGALEAGADPDDPVIEEIATMTLRGGRFALQVGGGCCDTGTFKVIGDRIAFHTPHGYTNTFTFKRSADGTLDLSPVLPMEVGDRVVTSSSPWTRVGPPVRKIP